MQGIYKIENLINNKVYIGQAVDIKRRLNKHKWFLKNDKHPNQHLQNSWNKYGKENFSFEVIESVSEKEDLTNCEQYYMDFVFNSMDSKNGYNKRSADLSPSFSEETLKKISENNKGKKLSEESRKKMSMAKKGVKRKPHSEETKRKIGESNRGRRMSKEQKEKLRQYKGENHWRHLKGDIKVKSRRKLTELERKQKSIATTRITEDIKQRIREEFFELNKTMKKLKCHELLSRKYNINSTTIRKIINYKY